MGIEKSKSSRLHPEGDGMAEALVKLVKSVIQKHVNFHGSDWDLFLQPAVFVICTNINNSTGTPAELSVRHNY